MKLYLDKIKRHHLQASDRQFPVVLDDLWAVHLAPHCLALELCRTSRYMRVHGSVDGRSSLIKRESESLSRLRLRIGSFSSRVQVHFDHASPVVSYLATRAERKESRLSLSCFYDIGMGISEQIEPHTSLSDCQKRLIANIARWSSVNSEWFVSYHRQIHQDTRDMSGE